MSRAPNEDELNATVQAINNLTASVNQRRECADEHTSILFHGAVCPLCAELEVNGELRRKRDEAVRNLTEFTARIDAERKTICANLKEAHDLLRSAAVKGMLVTP